MIDPVALTQDLVRCRSVTPADDGALDLVAAALEPAGFVCTRVDRGGIANLHARWGRAGPVLMLAGHTDVVPPGPQPWTHDPFGGVIADGWLYGRGAVDMKSGVAAMVAAAAAMAAEAPQGSIILLITGDEEAASVDGTVALLDWMRARGERADGCIVGEPCSLHRFGDQAKIGRRGSMNGRLTVTGVQGHSAYPERGPNPLVALSAICADLSSWQLDPGSAHFQPSTLVLTSIDTGNTATNVIPGSARAAFNIRFNDLHDAGSLQAAIAARVEARRGECGVALEWSVSGDSFLTPPGRLSDLLAEVLAARGLPRPALTTNGGTSDARFIKDLCPVIEFGLVGRTMHETDERVPVADITALTEVYLDMMRRFFAA